MSLEPEKITAYVDGELSDAERREVESLLESSAAAREQVETEHRVRQALKDLPLVEPESGFEQRLRRRLFKKRGHARIRIWLPIAASLALGLLWVRGTPQFVALELARDHRACFSMPELPAQVWSADETRVRAWFREQGTRVPALPNSAEDLRLVGARYCPLIGGSLAPHIYYSSAHRGLSVFVLERSVRFDRRYGAMASGTAVRLVRWEGTTLGIAAQDPRDVESFRKALDESHGRTLHVFSGRPRVKPGLTRNGAPVSLLRFRPSGAVAQLGARVNGIHEVMGSIPISSTNLSSNLAGRP